MREARRLGKAEREAIWEVTEYEPPVKREYVYSQGFGPIRQKGQTTFEATEGGTLVNFRAEIEAGFPLSLLLPVLARLMCRQNDKSFAKLKQVLETGGTALSNFTTTNSA